MGGREEYSGLISLLQLGSDKLSHKPEHRGWDTQALAYLATNRRPMRAWLWRAFCDCGIIYNATYLMGCKLIAYGKGKAWELTWKNADYCRTVWELVWRNMGWQSDRWWSTVGGIMRVLECGNPAS